MQDVMKLLLFCYVMPVSFQAKPKPKAPLRQQQQTTTTDNNDMPLMLLKLE
jgi:hypothetical protein